ncbi:MAG: hypothetical protein ABEJ65_00555 [bacterium]
MEIEPGLIYEIDWSDHRGTNEYSTIEEKLIKKHSVYPGEVEDAFLDGANPVGYQSLGEPGDPDLNGVRGLFFGKVEHARYLLMVAIVQPDGRAIVLSAREMTNDQQNHYKKHVTRRLL